MRSVQVVQSSNRRYHLVITNAKGQSFCHNYPSIARKIALARAAELVSFIQSGGSSNPNNWVKADISDATVIQTFAIDPTTTKE